MYRTIQKKLEKTYYRMVCGRIMRKKGKDVKVAFRGIKVKLSL
jgi:hypothetical protein